MVVVVKTEDQACGGSLPFYPFVEGDSVPGLAGGEGVAPSWEAEEPVWLTCGPVGTGVWPQTPPGLVPPALAKLQATLFASLTFYFQMNRLIKGTARKPCPCWCLKQSHVSVGG